MRLGLLAFMLISYNISLFSCDSSAEESGNEKKGDVGEGLNFTSTIAAGPNSWVVGDMEQDKITISDTGIHNWTHISDVIHSYIGVPHSGELYLGLKAKSPDGASKIKVTVGDKTEEVVLVPTEYATVEVGKFIVSKGYVTIKIQGLEKSGIYIGDISDILVGGSACQGIVTSVPTDNHYFGRRGPSVHMSYGAPEGKNVLWYYNEVTVPEGEDVVGSFFMANGHAQGYFGMQVNSESERRILFSIWSAFTTDDPNQIPDDYKVINLGNGEGVTVQDFGNEGSGKQSFKRFDWKAGTTYRFLLKGEPSVNNSTDYTAYFFAPEIGKWQLIASLRRPKTDTYLKRLHSFLENFIPSTGFMPREVQFGNQWAYTTEDEWLEMDQATFTADVTASQEHRLDYAGGVQEDRFYLRNCGFFNGSTQINSSFSRTSSNGPPNIDFSELPFP